MSAREAWEDVMRVSCRGECVVCVCVCLCVFFKDSAFA